MLGRLPVILLFVFVAAAPQPRFSGRCVGIETGDTIYVLHNGRTEKVWLYAIDCPELGQRYGTRAKQFASALAMGKIVSVRVTDTDEYGRIVGIVILPDGTFLNERLVAVGMAWWYREYAPWNSYLSQLEADARAAKRGLWADAQPIPPWAFREKERIKEWRRWVSSQYRPGYPVWQDAPRPILVPIYNTPVPNQYLLTPPQDLIRAPMMVGPAPMWVAPAPMRVASSPIRVPSASFNYG